MWKYVLLAIFVVNICGKAGQLTSNCYHDEPSPPLNLDLAWKDSNLSISWQHPDRPYGYALKFCIYISILEKPSCSDMEEQLNYRKEIYIDHHNISSTKLKVSITARNDIGESNTTSDEISVILPVPDKSIYLWLLFLIPIMGLIISGIIVKKICFSNGRITFGISSDREHTLSINSGASLNQSGADEDYIYNTIVLNEAKLSKLVKIEDYVSYIKTCVEQELFEKQYQMLPSKPLQSQEYGNKPENRLKNRYSNLIAYDENRVKLKVVNGDPYSDYINANYIDGYNSEKTYIATQGPLEETITDFWRLIWDEKVEYIIVTENVFEEGKRKFEKYWPEINGILDVDDFRITYVSVDVMVNYEIRYFTLMHNHEERSVKQYHFLSAPDRNRVSLYIHNLASFSRHILSIPQGNSPIVVQCCDGVGRSGITILIDICLRMSTKEGKIDVIHQLYKLRKQRFNMVDNVDQYKLVHFVLLQILQSIQIPSQTGIICNKNIEKKVANILTTKLHQQMQYLSSSFWQDRAMDSINLKASHFRKNSKNKPGINLPIRKGKISQTPSYRLANDPFMIINTIAVDSFSIPSRFMITAKPSNPAIGIFWQLVVEKQIKVIVCLNNLSFLDKNIPKFKPFDGVEVKIIEITSNSHYELLKLTIYREFKDKKTDLYIIHLTNWQIGSMHPENPNDLIKAYEEMNRLGKTSNTILITCHDGILASGLFVAMCFLIEKISVVQVCDVCLAVRNVRLSRKEFVLKREQLAFLYLCGLEYIRQFKTYSNFNPESEL